MIPPGHSWHRVSDPKSLLGSGSRRRSGLYQALFVFRGMGGREWYRQWYRHQHVSVPLTQAVAVLSWKAGRYTCACVSMCKSCTLLYASRFHCDYYVICDLNEIIASVANLWSLSSVLSQCVCKASGIFCKLCKSVVFFVGRAYHFQASKLGCLLEWCVCGICVCVWRLEKCRDLPDLMQVEGQVMLDSLFIYCAANISWVTSTCTWSKYIVALQ